jgi:predicted MFS family arabinose efflux permease
LIALVEMILVHKLEGKRDALIFISIGVLMAGAGYISLNILPHTAAAATITVIIITFAEMVCMPFMNSFWIRRTSPHNRGEYAALYSMSWSAAQVVGPFVGGYVIAFGGFGLLWWILGGMSLLIAMGYASIYWVNYRPNEIPNINN